MPVTCCDTGLAQELAGPLAAVLRSLNEPGRPQPAVAVAAHILAAEQLTVQAEACETCPGLADLCTGCRARSKRAATHRLAAADLQAEHGLVMQA